MKTLTRIVVLILPLLFIACGGKEHYFEYRTVSASGWDKDSVLIYDFKIEDASKEYDLLLHFRHFGDFPYQNVWLFTSHGKSGENRVDKDSVEFYLADDYGKWLGNGVGAIKEMVVLYRQAVHFPDSGSYRMEIRHGMRDLQLRGVSEVGLRIE